MGLVGWITAGSLVVGLVAIYMATWSKYGLLEKLERGFSDLREAGATLVTNIEGRMGDLLEVIRLLVPGQNSVEVSLDNLGAVLVHVQEITSETIEYRLTVQDDVFQQAALLELSNADEEFLRNEQRAFGEKEIGLSTLLGKRLVVSLPSGDEEACLRFMEYFLNWLDREYFQAVTRTQRHEERLGRIMQQGPDEADEQP